MGANEKHIEKKIKIEHSKGEPIYFSEYNNEALLEIIDTQKSNRTSKRKL